MKKSIFSFFYLVIVALLIVPASGLASDKIKLRWGSTSTKSGFYAYFVGLAKTAMTFYPELDIAVVETAAGLDNLKRLREGTVDFGGTNTAVAYAQYAAVADYSNKAKFSKLRSMWGGFVLPINIFVRADSDVMTLQDLHRKPFSHIPGSSADRLVLFLFDANGIKPRLLPLGAGSALDAVRIKRAVGSQRLGIGGAAILSLQATVDLRFIPISADQIGKTQAKYPGQVHTMELPANSFPKQVRAVPSLAYSAAEYTTSDLPDDVAYKVTKAIHKGSSRLAGLSKTLKLALFETAPWALEYQDVPLHAGSVRYFREIGVKIPSHLIPPEAR